MRRRLAVGIVVVAVVLITAQAGAALGGSGSATPERRPARVAVVVESGDTLWSIARRLVPGGDPRPVVDGLAEVRDGAPLQPGETVEWPT